MVNFLKNAYANNNIDDKLKLAKIENGYIKSSNGKLFYSYPFTDLNGVYDLNSLMLILKKGQEKDKAIEWIEEENSTVAKIGNLKIKLDKVEISKELLNFTTELENSEKIYIDEFTTILEQLSSFIAQNSPHSWASGLIFKDNNIIATNNIVIGMLENSYNSTRNFILPYAFVEEIARNKNNFQDLYINDTQAQAVFSHGGRITSPLVNTSKIPNLTIPFTKLDFSNSSEVLNDKEFLKALYDISAFCGDNIIYLNNDGLYSNSSEGKGAHIAYNIPFNNIRFNLKLFTRVYGLTDNIRIVDNKIGYAEKDNLKFLIMPLTL